MGVNIGILRRINSIHGRLTNVVLDGFTYDISYSDFPYKENGQPGKVGMITECLLPLIRSILIGSLGAKPGLLQVSIEAEKRWILNPMGDLAT
ncbi:hypothetical protein H5410_021670 [Solanum commersonii]|uniref:Uncharacterized protein n=1 Tax=Solanum commersonii TaxID=4109 RepID=A0A9J5ZD76_SOLCO|nr:hypothetical protein H5410_021670 [Solanum commersonii]